LFLIFLPYFHMLIFFFIHLRKLSVRSCAMNFISIILYVLQNWINSGLRLAFMSVSVVVLYLFWGTSPFWRSSISLNSS
jgi:hypothetical protein